MRYEVELKEVNTGTVTVEADNFADAVNRAIEEAGYGDMVWGTTNYRVKSYKCYGGMDNG